MSSDDAYSPSSGGGISSADSSPDSLGSFDELNSSDDDAAVVAAEIVDTIIPQEGAVAPLPVANHNQQPPNLPPAAAASNRRPPSRSAETPSAQRQRLAPGTPPNGGGGLPEGNGGGGSPRTPPNGGGGGVPESNGGDSRVSELNIQLSGMSTGGGADDDDDEGNNNGGVVVGAAAQGPVEAAVGFDNLVAGAHGNVQQVMVNVNAAAWQATIVLNESITINGVVIEAGQSILFSSCVGNYNNLGVGSVGAPYGPNSFTFSADRNTITRSPVASFTNTGHQVTGITITRQVVQPPVVYQHPTLYPITNNGQSSTRMRTVLVRDNGNQRIIMVVDKTDMLRPIFACNDGSVSREFPNIIIRDYQLADGPARILDEAHQLLPRADLWMPARYFPLNRHRNGTSFSITVARVRRAAQRYHDPNMDPMPREVGSGPKLNQAPFHNYELGDDNVDAAENNV